jgi:hypothetical protein
VMWWECDRVTENGGGRYVGVQTHKGYGRASIGSATGYV